MRRASLLAAIPALLVMAAATYGCNPMDVVDTDDPLLRSASVEPATRKALAVVSTMHAHQMAERAGERVVYHPGWSSRIRRVDAAGRSQEIYRQTRPYKGTHASEAVLGFRDVALAVFDPNQRIVRITAETVDGETWSLDDRIWSYPPPPRDTTKKVRPPEMVEPTDSVPPPAPEEPVDSVPPPETEEPIDPALLALAPAERARASVNTGPEHRVTEAAGERVTFHPGWASRIQRVDAAGRSREIYRQTQPYKGADPSEGVFGFRDVALAVFDPNQHIVRITVETLTGETWSLDNKI